MRSIVSTDKAPKAIGPYSQGVIVEGKLFYSAGQIPMDPKTGEIAGTDIKAQTKQALENLKAVVEAAGSDLTKIVKNTVFMKDMNDFADMNEVYGSYFTENPPARSAVEVARLPKDVLVEIECIALVS